MLQDGETQTNSMVTRDSFFFFKIQFPVARACVSSELFNLSVFSSHSTQIPIIHSFYAQWPPLVITCKIFYIIFMRFWPLIIRPFFMIFQFLDLPKAIHCKGFTIRTESVLHQRMSETEKCIVYNVISIYIWHF